MSVMPRWPRLRYILCLQCGARVSDSSKLCQQCGKNPRTTPAVAEKKRSVWGKGR